MSSVLHTRMKHVTLPLCRWAAVPDDEWPEPGMQRDVVIQDFDLSSAFGDRRQEIVFIGRSMQQDAISQRLDGALLTDAEMDQHKQRFCKVGLRHAHDESQPCRRPYLGIGDGPVAEPHLQRMFMAYQWGATAPWDPEV